MRKKLAYGVGLVAVVLAIVVPPFVTVSVRPYEPPLRIGMTGRRTDRKGCVGGAKKPRTPPEAGRKPRHPLRRRIVIPHLPVPVVDPICHGHESSERGPNQERSPKASKSLRKAAIAAHQGDSGNAVTQTAAHYERPQHPQKGAGATGNQICPESKRENLILFWLVARLSAAQFADARIVVGVKTVLLGSSSCQRFLRFCTRTLSNSAGTPWKKTPPLLNQASAFACRRSNNC
jgi:hypothetical protein